jgi:acyl dehydratase
MPTLDLNVVGRKTRPVLFEYTRRDAVLYALAVGAGAGEDALLRGREMLPSFCLIAERALIPEMRENTVGFDRLLAGNRLRILRPVAPEGRMVVQGEVSEILDKEKLSVIVTRFWGRTEDGEPVFEAETSVFVRGVGGFGGPRGASEETHEPPGGKPPDLLVSESIPETQSHLFQLLWVDDPLHVDAEVARSRGFEKPVLHAPCTFGYLTRAVVAGFCGGDAARLCEIGVRYSGVVLPGDTLDIEGWRLGGERFVLRAHTQRGPALTRGYAVVE